VDDYGEQDYDAAGIYDDNEEGAEIDETKHRIEQNTIRSNHKTEPLELNALNNNGPFLSKITMEPIQQP